MDEMLAEFIAVENMSFAKMALSDTTMRDLVRLKYDQYAKALKMKILKDIVDVGHMKVSITFDGGSSNDEMKSKKYPVIIHWTMKDFVIKSDTIGLFRTVGSQQA